MAKRRICHFSMRIISLRIPLQQQGLGNYLGPLVMHKEYGQFAAYILVLLLGCIRLGK